jgi:hypothetical protein
MNEIMFLEHAREPTTLASSFLTLKADNEINQRFNRGLVWKNCWSDDTLQTANRELREQYPALQQAPLEGLVRDDEVLFG